MAGNKKGRILTHELCKEIASTCKNIGELRKKDSSVCRKCYDMGWNNEFFPNKRRKRTYELCKKIASTCKTLKELQEKDSSIYAKCMQTGWHIEFFSKRRPTYTTDEIIVVAQKCKTLAEFRDTPFYHAALSRNLMDTFTWLKRYNVDKSGVPLNCVYAYIFEKAHTVYVGITIDKKSRHSRHKYGAGGDSAVYKFAVENNFYVPEPIYIYDNITTADASYLEQVVIDDFRANGWTILNRCKGGSTGKLNSRKWPKYKCIRIARRFKYLSSLRKIYPQVAIKMKNKGWLSDCTWLIDEHAFDKPKGYYANMTLDQIMTVAKHFKTRSSFESECVGAYKVARKNKWLDLLFPKKASARPVNVYLRDGITLVAQYPMVSDAAKAFRCSGSVISAVCRGKAKSARGHIFKYADK